MTLEELKSAIPDYGRDIRLNLDSVLSEEGAPGLSLGQIHSVALACAYALAERRLVDAIRARHDFSPEAVHAAKAAASIMAMNNVYYRAQHLMEDAELKKMPARLRMTVIGKPGVDKVDFELMSFAISALAGCGQCLTAHLNELRKSGVPNEGAHSALRIASVMRATQAALAIADWD